MALLYLHKILFIHVYLSMYTDIWTVLTMDWVMAFIQSITKPLNEEKKNMNGMNTDSLSYGRLKNKMHCTVTKIIR